MVINAKVQIIFYFCKIIPWKYFWQIGILFLSLQIEPKMLLECRILISKEVLL